MLCVGCCCGRVDRGKAEVPVEALKAAWNEHRLVRHAQLTVSGCLGPCDLHNVVLLMREGKQTWLGELRAAAHFEALVAWAPDVVEHGADAKLPEILAPHRFERWETDA
ncbi:MAG: (2Fe-2S) ferredoxin domain-containing protein [Planctomycetota bacterium]